MDDEIARNSLIGEWETLIALPQCTTFNRPIAAAFTMWQRPVEQSNEVFSQLLFASGTDAGYRIAAFRGHLPRLIK